MSAVSAPVTLRRGEVDLARHLPPRLAGQLIAIAQGTGAIHAPQDSPRLAWERAGLDQAAAAGGLIAATSTAMRHHLINGYRLDPAAVIDLRNGLTTSELPTAPEHPTPTLPREAGARFILAMGRAEPHKGFDDLIDAVAILRGTGAPVPHLLLAAVTDDPEPNPFQRHLARRITDQGLDATLWTRFDRHPRPIPRRRTPPDRSRLRLRAHRGTVPAPGRTVAAAYRPPAPG